MSTSSPNDVNSVAIPGKRAYGREEFVGRHKELDMVAQRVLQGKKGDKIALPVLNFWGMEGGGKSWLLRHVSQMWRGPGRLRKGECKRTFTALFEFAGFDPFEWTSPSLAALLKPGIRDITDQLAGVAREMPADLLAHIRAAEAEEEPVEKLAQAFVAWIISLIDQSVPLVLLDTTERVTPEALFQLELSLIEPLARTDHVIIITAGRHEVARWRRFAVRSRQSEPIQLKSLSLQDTTDQIRRQGFELPGELVYNYSFGLAYASQVLAAAISELSDGRSLDERFLRENEHRLESWLVALEAHLLQAVSPELADVLRVLCVLRAIREGALPYLLPGKKNGEEYRGLLDELEATPLVWWDPDQGTYMMPTSLRRLLSLRLRFQEPDLYSERHRRAAEYYLQATGENPYDCGLYLIEALYHKAYGYADQLPDKVEELLDQVFKPDNFTVGGAEFLLERLRDDEELRSALPAPLFDQVVQAAQTLRQKVRRMRLSPS